MRNLHIVYKKWLVIYILINSLEEFLFDLILAKVLFTVFCLIFLVGWDDISFSLWFDLHFHNALLMLSISFINLWSFACLLLRNSYSDYLPIFTYYKLVFLLLNFLSFFEFLNSWLSYILNNNLLSDKYIACNSFLAFCRLLLCHVNWFLGYEENLICYDHKGQVCLFAILFFCLCLRQNPC